MSLRARLLAGLVLLVAAGLAVAAVATYTEQRSFLYDRVDQQVLDSVMPIYHTLGLGGHDEGSSPDRGGGDQHGGGGPQEGPPPTVDQTPGTFGERVDGAGKVIGLPVTFRYGGNAAAAPALPHRYPICDSANHPRFFTVDSTSGSSLRYRVLALRAPSGTGATIVAVPLTEADATLHRLQVVELLVAGGVLLALALLAWVVIRVGLRPLERMGRVAGEIAAGNLSRRVSPDDPRTEVGRLGMALNGMLVRIEQAFADRRASEERLRRFLADASHELRTPLASIRGYAELFRLGAAREPKDVERAMSRIEGEATRMGVLVEDMLVLARMDELPEPRREPVDLAELIEHAAADARATAPARPIQVHAPQPISVPGDPDQLRQVLANLLRNALTHTPDASPIELSLTAEDGAATVEVRDHGPGLPAGAAEQVFERFWRAEGGRSRGRAGAGLGLAIVQAIVHAHGGEVTAGNASDGGAVFRIRLPR